MDAAVSLGKLRGALESQPDVSAAVILPPTGAGAMPSLADLRTADAAVLYGGTGDLAAADAAILREFVQQGKGLLVIREQTARWTTWPEFLPGVLGAKRQGTFAKGAPMRVINLFGHAIFTGVRYVETGQSMPLYAGLTPDSMLVMEGTVGEATAPLGWLRQNGRGRIAHIVPASTELFGEPGYMRLLVNTLLWTARRPIPGARALVQRTYLPNAYPGAIAITFPEGPTLCFDPARGGVSHVSDGDFVDLRPRWLTKQGEPAKISGEQFFHDAGRSPYWTDAVGAEPNFQFMGYGVKEEFPELHYRVGDREVREQLRPAASGIGLVRELRIGAGRQQLSYRHEPQAGADIVMSGGARATDTTAFSVGADAAVVRMEIRPKRVVAP